MTKIIQSGLSLNKRDNKKSTFVTVPEIALSTCVMAKTVTGYSILVYDMELVAPNDINVCTKFDATTVRVSDTTITLNETEHTIASEDIEITPGTYNYILIDTDGNLVLSHTYIENHALVSIVLTNETEITEVLNFANKSKYIAYKKQIDDNGTWAWDDRTIHILGAGKNPKFLLDNDTLDIFFEKNGGVFKRQININGDISEFQYKNDYPEDSGIIRPNDFVEYVGANAASDSLAPINLYNPYYMEFERSGLVTSTDDYTTKFYVRLPFLINKNVKQLKYVSITGFSLFDEDFAELETYPLSDAGSFIEIPKDGKTYHIGFNGEYSVVSSRIYIKQIILNISDYINYQANDEETKILNFKESSSSSTFGITVSYDNKIQQNLEQMSANASSDDRFGITTSYDAEQELTGDELEVGASTANIEFTIH